MKPQKTPKTQKELNKRSVSACSAYSAVSQYFDRISEAPDAIPRLRRFILDLAVRGKLVEQDPNDESAAELLKRIEIEKARRVGAGQMIKIHSLSPIKNFDITFPLPDSWQWVRLGDIFDYDAGTKTEPKQLPKDAWLLELEDIEKDSGRIIQRRTVDERSPKSTKSGFLPGDVLYGKLRPYLNKAVVADSPGFSTTEIVALRCYGESFPFYTCLALRRPDFVDYVTRLGQGTKMPRLRTEDAVSAGFPLPPLAEQNRILAKVDELMDLCDELETAQQKRERRRNRLITASLAKLTDETENKTILKFSVSSACSAVSRPEHIHQLRQTILNLAVRGKLVPQDPKDEPASDLLKRIQAYKEQMIREGKIKKEKPLQPISKLSEPFGIPSSWAWTRIGICSLITEYGTSVKSAHLDHGVPVLNMGDIQGGQVILKDQKRVPRSIDDLPKLFLKHLDILYNRTNSAELVGKTGIFMGRDDIYTFASYLIRIRFINHLTSPIYANLAMNAPYFRKSQIIPELKQQCGQANVNGTKLKNMMIPLPPLAEQRRIVEKVDELMGICDRLEARLSTTAVTSRQLLESTLMETIEVNIRQSSTDKG